MSKAPSSAELAMPSEASFAGLDVAMAFRDARLHTYLCKDNPWPFTEDCKCTPEKMADAGFYFIGTEKEPDLVRCYWCRKEMDGWEPQDDPMAEHRRSEGCPFIKLGKPCPKLVFDDMLKLETVRGKFLAVREAKNVVTRPKMVHMSLLCSVYMWRIKISMRCLLVGYGVLIYLYTLVIAMQLWWVSFPAKNHGEEEGVISGDSRGVSTTHGERGEEEGQEGKDKEEEKLRQKTELRRKRNTV